MILMVDKFRSKARLRKPRILVFASPPRKRPPQELSQPPSKRQKPKYPRGSQPPTSFWDNLSKLWLTKRALKEFDRRNTQLTSSVRHSLSRQAHRQVTRQSIAKWKQKEENWEPTEAAANFLARCSTGRLEEIKLLTRHGGQDLSDLRGYQKPICPLYRIMSSSQSSSRGGNRNSIVNPNTKTCTPTTTRKTRPYDRNFQQALTDGGLCYEYPDGRVPAKPKNWEEVNQRLIQPRPSLSLSNFSEEAHIQFVMESMIPIIEGAIKDASCVSGGIPFTNLDPLTDSTLVPGNPDRYYGARPEQLNQQTRTELSNQIIPSTQGDLPIAPNFFLTGKGPDGSAAVAGRQASYDGALGARGIQSLQSHGQDEPSINNNKYTITSIYHNGQLKMYTSHRGQPDTPRSRPEYYMTQIKCYALTSDLDTFRRGATAFRNARDWAKEQRDEAIRRANKRTSVSNSHATSGPTTQPRGK
ncbi:hypothetical protein BJ875DRAFT_507856 [Amylocarpus encephaloides]|uniref:Uncharacterized protein n=1 Tax=Amylocarpus encephaloides TaxID=45428 RepID=A0A9P8C0S9_9HELO|nr:hypothetical protein BJ875DRAFT_507856 [Amylocarpus encephaloides]